MVGWVGAQCGLKHVRLRMPKLVCHFGSSFGIPFCSFPGYMPNLVPANRLAIRRQALAWHEQNLRKDPFQLSREERKGDPEAAAAIFVCDPNFYPPTEASTATSTDCLYLCDACTLRAMHIILHTPPSPQTRLWDVFQRWCHAPLNQDAWWWGRWAWATAPTVRRLTFFPGSPACRHSCHTPACRR